MFAEEPLVKEIFIEASPELVFTYLVEREKMLRWLGLALEIDPRPGGIFQMDPNGQELIRGEYREILPPKRILFTWGGSAATTKFPPDPRSSKSISCPGARVLSCA